MPYYQSLPEKQHSLFPDQVSQKTANLPNLPFCSNTLIFTTEKGDRRNAKLTFPLNSFFVDDDSPLQPTIIQKFLLHHSITPTKMKIKLIFQAHYQFTQLGTRKGIDILFLCIIRDKKNICLKTNKKNKVFPTSSNNIQITSDDIGYIITKTMIMMNEKIIIVTNTVIVISATITIMERKELLSV